MAWEWVAPVATAASGMTGVYFTWLTGRQSRSQIQDNTLRAEAHERRTRLAEERRRAYLAALHIFRLQLTRRSLSRRRRTEELSDLDQVWSVGDRLRLTAEAAVAVDAFGSADARHYIQQWVDAGDDEELLRTTYARFLAVVQRDLRGHVEFPESAGLFRGYNDLAGPGRQHSPHTHGSSGAPPTDPSGAVSPPHTS